MEIIILDRVIACTILVLFLAQIVVVRFVLLQFCSHEVYLMRRGFRFMMPQNCAQDLVLLLGLFWCKTVSSCLCQCKTLSYGLSFPVQNCEPLFVPFRAQNV